MRTNRAKQNELNKILTIAFFLFVSVMANAKQKQTVSFNDVNWEAVCLRVQHNTMNEQEREKFQKIIYRDYQAAHCHEIQLEELCELNQ